MGLGLGLLALLESLRGMAHARQGEEGIDAFGLGNGGAFFGQMARQAVESAAGEVFAASVDGDDLLAIFEAALYKQAVG